jgi:hypothetical protein
MLLFLAGMVVGIVLIICISILVEKHSGRQKGSERWQCRVCLRTFLWRDRHIKKFYNRYENEVRSYCPYCDTLKIEKV